MDYSYGNPTLVVLDPARIRVKSIVEDPHQGFKGRTIKTATGSVTSQTLTKDEIRTPAGHRDHVPVRGGVPEGWRGKARTK